MGLGDYVMMVQRVAFSNFDIIFLGAQQLNMSSCKFFFLFVCHIRLDQTKVKQIKLDQTICLAQTKLNQNDLDQTIQIYQT